tara:strand:- start:676 stop:1311 length:636 start_codon:yes stop_codon:yes gene_type:complete
MTGIKTTPVKSAIAAMALAGAAFCLPVSAANATVLDMEGFAPPANATTESTSRNMNGFNLYTGHGHYIDSAHGSVGSAFPDNGTDFLLHDNNGPIILTKIGGGAFSIQSFDASERHLSFATGETINVSATLFGGGGISTAFTLDDTFGFETLTFDASWTNLASVTFQNANGHIAYDNIVVDAPVVVSAPGPLAILGLGILGLGLARRNRAA